MNTTQCFAIISVGASKETLRKHAYCAGEPQGKHQASNETLCGTANADATIKKNVRQKQIGTSMVVNSSNEIRINGHVLNSPLLVDDPDVKRTVPDASGQMRHVRSFTQPGRLKNYVKKHPEGMILAGVGNIFFLEPVIVPSAAIRFEESGGADILVREEAESVEKQLTAMEEIQAEALKCTL